jgi:hypothetical protein
MKSATYRDMRVFTQAKITGGRTAGPTKAVPKAEAFGMEGATGMGMTASTLLVGPFFYAGGLAGWRVILGA